MPVKGSATRASPPLQSPYATVTTARKDRRDEPLDWDAAAQHVKDFKGAEEAGLHPDTPAQQAAASITSRMRRPAGNSKAHKDVSKASLLRQSAAVLLKDLALARRSWLGAVGMLCLPILLLGLLLVVQHLVDQVRLVCNAQCYFRLCPRSSGADVCKASMRHGSHRMFTLLTLFAATEWS
jgi:hypothetical protein